MDALQQVWQEYHTRLLSFIVSRVSDPTVADDILQDVFLKIQKGLKTLKETNKLKSWIYTITRNTIIDYYRSHKRMEELPESLSSPEKNPTGKARKDIEHCMMPMINNLPDEYRETVILSEIEGLKQKEVAERQNISLSAAKSRIQRGRKMVKEMLIKCCAFELDHQGTMIDYEPKDSSCDTCS